MYRFACKISKIYNPRTPKAQTKEGAPSPNPLPLGVPALHIYIVHIYLKNNPVKFNPDPIWNDGTLSLLEEVAPTRTARTRLGAEKKEIRSKHPHENIRPARTAIDAGRPNKMSSDLGSVSHPKSKTRKPS